MEIFSEVTKRLNQSFSFYFNTCSQGMDGKKQARGSRFDEED